jgi:tetratricopeptide (TPR) repeat protein
MKPKSLFLMFGILFCTNMDVDAAWTCRQALGKVVEKIILPGAAEVIRPNTPGDTRTKTEQFWGGVANEFIDDGKNRLQAWIRDVEEVSDSEGSQLLMKLRESIDDKTSKSEFLAMVERMNSEMAKMESNIRDLEYSQSRIEQRVNDNSREIQNEKELNNARKREFDNAVARIDVAFAELRGRVNDLARSLQEERIERVEADLELDSRLDRVEHHLDPETRRKTAAILAADGALSLVKQQDPVEASRVLQLAVAYDEIANQHSDPGSRYFLAIAYRRMGKHTQADETIAEAIVAERYRYKPEWYDLVIERLQGDDRRWGGTKPVGPP